MHCAVHDDSGLKAVPTDLAALIWHELKCSKSRSDVLFRTSTVIPLNKSNKKTGLSFQAVAGHFNKNPNLQFFLTSKGEKPTSSASRTRARLPFTILLAFSATEDGAKPKNQRHFTSQFVGRLTSCKCSFRT